ncbi:glyoxalase-like domain-containing protein [Stachybotrys elegans]|uniref:Glyoxalase-like domain-containing protein n=1 Tax=Stachybotrys elegans TaxID=80388 RepID=A0A8K0T558_9HYPO|nr:glyoxalase-like domain-containing protein [Stachybotrys elegans]
MASSTDGILLDHIVILVSESTLRDLPAKLKDDFNVTVGGTHADGLTLNNLIFFEDGVYIEVIAFFDAADDETRKKHRWGQLQENTIIDWAYTLPDKEQFPPVQQRVVKDQPSYVYSDPVPGGRKRPDGTVLEWAVAAANRTDGRYLARGALPFWCLDVTPRHLRVPYQDEGKATHGCGATGVAEVSIGVGREDVADLERAHRAILHGQLEYGVPVGKPVGKVHLVPSEDSSISIKLTGRSEGRVQILPGLELEIVPS